MIRDWDSWLIACLLTALAALMLGEAARRHLWPDSPAWTVKAASGCLAWLVSIGMAKAAESRLHIRVGSLLPLLPESWRGRAGIFGDSMFLFFCLASFVIGCVVLFRAFDRSIPDALVCLAIPVGSALTMYRLVERLLSTRSSRQTKTEADADGA
ncbi:MAG: TRAP transporter small permease subunit [Planctomycetes bacterium]|nr:TRAP transporter small permease subunit [Planctomycetota bacterium]